ncbi:hypothetical protein OHB26_24740 [Nocardia sp. NBC_01503]|uniref:hypothetical protein n=1 Tax=Nocardia sp. NBC_01503 TaxID=2975997 RepID=UPI002E7B07AE|nr:hypothetical protein [Nocardia sp. NBC_01503]WTL30148.1 hypothetical protein OHB26_24740 [Nocardia sp. NBC_01503]
MSEAWMNIMSISRPGVDPVFEVKYSENINKIVITVGEGRLFMDAEATEQLLTGLREGLLDAMLAQAVKSGEGVWLSPTTFLTPEAAVALRSERGAA